MGWNSPSECLWDYWTSIKKGWLLFQAFPSSGAVYLGSEGTWALVEGKVKGTVGRKVSQPDAFSLARTQVSWSDTFCPWPGLMNLLLPPTAVFILLSLCSIGRQRAFRLFLGPKTIFLRTFSQCIGSCFLFCHWRLNLHFFINCGSCYFFELCVMLTASLFFVWMVAWNRNWHILCPFLSWWRCVMGCVGTETPLFGLMRCDFL